MATLDMIDFGSLTDEQIGEAGSKKIRRDFRRNLRDNLLNGENFVWCGGYLTEDDGYYEMMCGDRGDDRETIAKLWSNVDPDTGKFATVLDYKTSSVDAYKQHGDDVIIEGPRRYTGGVIVVVHVLTRDMGWRTRTFVGAASGVQGHFDQAMIAAALYHMGALWAMKMQALHKKPGQ